MNHTRLILTRTVLQGVSCRFGHKLVIREHGNPLKVQELQKQDRPKLSSPDNIVIGVLAATLNPADVNVVEGFYPVRPALPGTGGIDGVAQVLEVGSNVKNFKVGDRVWPYTMKLGMFQTYIQCRADQVLPADPRLDLVQAATLQANPATAYLMIKMGNLKKGDTLIQNAANSAVGQCVMQIASAWGINTVNIVRARSDIDKVRKLLTEYGATIVVTDDDVKKDAVTDPFWNTIPKPKLALNAVGGKHIIRIAQLLDRGSLCVTYGGMSAQPVMIPSQAFIFGSQRYVGFWLTWREMRKLTETDHVQWREMLKELTDLSVAGRLRPPVCEVRPATEWKQAFETAYHVGGGGGADKVKHRAKQILTFYDPKKDD